MCTTTHRFWWRRWWRWFKSMVYIVFVCILFLKIKLYFHNQVIICELPKYFFNSNGHLSDNNENGQRCLKMEGNSPEILIQICWVGNLRSYCLGHLCGKLFWRIKRTIFLNSFSYVFQKNLLNNTFWLQPDRSLFCKTFRPRYNQLPSNTHINRLHFFHLQSQCGHPLAFMYILSVWLHIYFYISTMKTIILLIIFMMYPLYEKSNW